jgi:hypothetical protein
MVFVMMVIVIVMMVMVTVMVMMVAGRVCYTGVGFVDAQPTHGERGDDRYGKGRAQKNLLQRGTPAFIDAL